MSFFGGFVDMNDLAAKYKEEHGMNAYFITLEKHWDDIPPKIFDIYLDGEKTFTDLETHFVDVSSGGSNISILNDGYLDFTHFNHLIDSE